MELLSNEVLIHCHKDAVSLNLEQAFIDMLVKEIRRRNLETLCGIAPAKTSTLSA
ncbi:MAG: Sporulation inhibitor [Paenibacillaceae bacterium]|jgi:hypothetical protein|nr:Sporulation inhibitor [Paenibacillaceae bacterium]